MDDKEKNRAIERFEGFRYSLRAPDKLGPDDLIPQITSFYTFPKSDVVIEPDDRDESSSSEED